ncbi:hypothetical protein MBANPS3_000598 [Mucor bainieri]
MSTAASAAADTITESLLLSSSDYDNEELARLVELQRRQTELLQPDIDTLDFDDDDDDQEEDDFSVTNKRASLRKGPTVPDMRFEKQVEKSIALLQEKGASNFSILWSVVVKDNILIPFVSGFTWSVCSTAWTWYRTRGVVNARNPAKKFGFFRGIQHGIAEWTKLVYNAVAGSTQHLLNSTPTMASS